MSNEELFYFEAVGMIICLLAARLYANYRMHKLRALKRQLDAEDAGML
jgi:hypothetical protein